jgi:hypothetical protein
VCDVCSAHLRCGCCSWGKPIASAVCGAGVDSARHRPLSNTNLQGARESTVGSCVRFGGGVFGKGSSTILMRMAMQRERCFMREVQYIGYVLSVVTGML